MGKKFTLVLFLILIIGLLPSAQIGETVQNNSPWTLLTNDGINYNNWLDLTTVEWQHKGDYYIFRTTFKGDDPKGFSPITLYFDTDLDNSTGDMSTNVGVGFDVKVEKTGIYHWSSNSWDLFSFAVNYLENGTMVEIGIPTGALPPSPRIRMIVSTSNLDTDLVDKKVSLSSNNTATITVDGDLNDWATVEPAIITDFTDDISTPSIDVTNANFVQDDNFVYGALQIPDFVFPIIDDTAAPMQQGEFLIDADANVTTGEFDNNGHGYDFKVLTHTWFNSSSTESYSSYMVLQWNNLTKTWSPYMGNQMGDIIASNQGLEFKLDKVSIGIGPQSVISLQDMKATSNDFTMPVEFDLIQDFHEGFEYTDGVENHSIIYFAGPSDQLTISTSQEANYSGQLGLKINGTNGGGIPTILLPINQPAVKASFWSVAVKRNGPDFFTLRLHVANNLGNGFALDYGQPTGNHVWEPGGTIFDMNVFWTTKDWYILERNLTADIELATGTDGALYPSFEFDHVLMLELFLDQPGGSAVDYLDDLIFSNHPIQKTESTTSISTTISSSKTTTVSTTGISTSRTSSTTSSAIGSTTNRSSAVSIQLPTPFPFIETFYAAACTGIIIRRRKNR